MEDGILTPAMVQLRYIKILSKHDSEAVKG